MSKRLLISAVALLAGLALSPVIGAQTAPHKTAGDEPKPGTWNSLPPIKPFYAGKKSGPAPKRDLSGVWDAAEADGGRQPSGAIEHPALMKPRGQGIEGGQPDETGIMHPLSYTPEGLAALKANMPSGPGVRQVPASLSNDPMDQCDPIGFPRMELYELRTFELLQNANQVVYLNQYFGNFRVIWTDGRELPKDAGAAVERLLGRKMGGRLHVRGRDDRAESQKLARSRRPSAQRCSARGRAISPRGS